MPARRAAHGSQLLARLLTGPLAFLVAGAIDVSTLWARWGAGALAARLARRSAR